MSPMPLVLIGGGDQAGTCANLLHLLRTHGLEVPDIIGFYDDGDDHDPLLADLDIAHLGLIAGGAPSPHAVGLLAIGSGRTRLALVEAVTRLSAGPVAALVHPSTTVGLRTVIEPGCTILGYNWIGPRVHIGAHALVTADITIGHGAVIGRAAAIYPGVHLGGDVVIGAGSTLGTNATILPRVTVGERAIVGAGAVVTTDVPAGATVAGVPAKVLRGSGA